MSKKILFKAFLYLGIFHTLSWALSALMETRFMQFLSVQHIVGADFTYNDLFYRVQAKNEEDQVGRMHKEEILLVNTANLDQNNFRSELANVLHKVESFKPKAVGVDITFSNRTDSATRVLLQELIAQKNIVCAFKTSVSSSETLQLPSSLKRGDVDFPAEQHSIRFYKGGDETFAYQLFKLARGEKASSEVAATDKFPIAYSSIHDGVVAIDDIVSDAYHKNYKVIDAQAFLSDSSSEEHYTDFLRGSILIIGHMGSGPFDMEDKHAVPTDTNRLLNRVPIMPGAAIHANALSNLLDDHIFHEPHSLMVEIVLNLLMLLMVILILNQPLKIMVFGGLVVFSIVWIWLAMYFMEFNIYIQVGTTLIELMILEEFVETAEPFVDRIGARIQRKKNGFKK
jgi:hypothetical protein